jgi:hypothetical protein
MHGAFVLLLPYLDRGREKLRHLESGSRDDAVREAAAVG